jgi:hypothetical protein
MKSPLYKMWRSLVPKSRAKALADTTAAIEKIANDAYDRGVQDAVDKMLAEIDLLVYPVNDAVQAKRPIDEYLSANTLRARLSIIKEQL